MEHSQTSLEKKLPEMPLCSRRRFLATLGFSAAALAIDPGKLLHAEVGKDIPVDSNHLVLLADTHCGPNLKHQLDFLRKSISEIVAMNPRPAHVLIYGDFAFLYGKREDYVVLQELMVPLHQAGIPWTTCMGNHDRRDTFTEIFPEHAQKSLLSDRLVFRVETPFVDFLLLDSLIQSDDPNRWITPGEILPDQKDWLHETLKSQTKPVIVGSHHLLNETKIADVLKSHSCVAGYLNGHAHYWNGADYEGVPALTLPSNGHWGDIGIVNLRLTPKEAVFQLTMRDYLLGNKPPEFEPNPERPKQIAAKQGAIWRLDLA
ncbi:MAG: metallophosphoesterase [Planctomycetia bacterium]|nr:metallophosphoesterase [Planctomycetia bacterium]